MRSGAILKFAVTAHVNGFNIQTAGVVLLVVGIIGLVLAMWYTFVYTRQRDVRVVDDRTQRY